MSRVLRSVLTSMKKHVNLRMVAPSHCQSWGTTSVVLLIWILLVQFPTEVFAEKVSPEDGYAEAISAEAYRRGNGVQKNLRIALELAEISASKSNPIGLYNLAVMYQNGVGLERDEARANDLFYQAANDLERLAENGDDAAQTDLAYMYRYGKGVERNYAKALQYNLWAASKGNLYAQYSLGIVYENGLGVTQDYREAFNWFRIAAERGSLDAQVTLAISLEHGQGVALDRATALEWYQKAALLGDTTARERLARAYASLVHSDKAAWDAPQSMIVVGTAQGKVFDATGNILDDRDRGFTGNDMDLLIGAYRKEPKIPFIESGRHASSVAANNLYNTIVSSLTQMFNSKQARIFIVEKIFTPVDVLAIKHIYLPYNLEIKFVVDHIRGEVIRDKGLWERIEFSIFLDVRTDRSYRISYDEFASIHLKCIIDGRYAAGFRPPDDGDYEYDMEPLYREDLRNYAFFLLSHLRDQLEADVISDVGGTGRK